MSHRTDKGILDKGIPDKSINVSEAGYLTGLADRGEARIVEARAVCVERLCGSGWIPKCAMYLA